jgi:hypothetical protein
MNKEKQQIAIAEACGWKPNPFQMDMRGQVFPQSPPDYLNDLNAMREVEETLTEHEWNQMFEWLIHIRWRDANATERHGIGKQKALSPSRATAAQRAEALLKALKLWKDA